jgi:hypothetical protein
MKNDKTLIFISVLPKQCLPGNYRTLSEASRSISRGVATNCDGYKLLKGTKTSPSWTGPSWYKFAYPAGTKIATKPPPKATCGTHATGWMNATHPTEIGQTKSVKLCFNWRSTCWKTSYGEVTKCGEGDFVYRLPDVPPYTRSRYCAVP